MQFVQFACYIWTFYFSPLSFMWAKYLSFAVLLLYMIIMPMISIIQYGLSYEHQLFSDESAILPYLNTSLLVEENHMKAWMASYPLQGVMLIIYYCTFIHSLTRELSVLIVYQLHGTDFVYNIMNLTKRIGPGDTALLDEGETIYRS